MIAHLVTSVFPDRLSPQLGEADASAAEFIRWGTTLITDYPEDKLTCFVCSFATLPLSPLKAILSLIMYFRYRSLG